MLGTMRRSRTRTRETIALLHVFDGAEQDVRSRLKLADVRSWSPRLLTRLPGGYRGDEALFPGYVFSWIDRPSCWRAARHCRGVIDYVRGEGGAPRLVAPEIVSEIRARENEFGYVVLEPPLEIGQAVRVEGGGSAVGIVKGMLPKNRVQVLFSLLGREVSLSLRVRDLVPAA